MSDSYADDGYGEIIPVDSFGLSPTPSAILAMLYFLVSGLSFSKDVVPRVYRWAKQKRYKPRLLMIFCLICFSTLRECNVDRVTEKGLIIFCGM